MQTQIHLIPNEQHIKAHIYNKTDPRNVCAGIPSFNYTFVFQELILTAPQSRVS